MFLLSFPPSVHWGLWICGADADVWILGGTGSSMRYRRSERVRSPVSFLRESCIRSSVIIVIQGFNCWDYTDRIALDTRLFLSPPLSPLVFSPFPPLVFYCPHIFGLRAFPSFLLSCWMHGFNLLPSCFFDQPIEQWKPKETRPIILVQLSECVGVCVYLRYINNLYAMLLKVRSLSSRRAPAPIPFSLLRILLAPLKYLSIRPPDPNSPIVRARSKHPIRPIHRANLPRLPPKLHSGRSAQRGIPTQPRPRGLARSADIEQERASVRCAPAGEPPSAGRDGEFDVEGGELLVGVLVAPWIVAVSRRAVW